MKKKRGKGLFGDILSTIGKSAYYVGSKIIDPFNDLSYGEIHAPKLGLKGGIIPGLTFSKTAGPGTHIIDRVREGRLDNDP